MEKANKYYAVKAKCGHVGRKYYLPIIFGVKAINAKEAAKIARDIPRVKHHHKDAILDVKEISYKEYVDIRKNNSEDTYLKVSSKQDQNLYCLNIDERLIKEERYHKTKHNREEKLAFLKLKEISLVHETRRERYSY